MIINILTPPFKAAQNYLIIFANRKNNVFEKKNPKKKIEFFEKKNSEKLGSPDFSTYEDREFYTQMLREIVNAGSSSATAASVGGGGGSSNGTHHDEEMKKLLHSKKEAKRLKKMEFERRASKGRKIRFMPIEKLENFTAPGAVKSGRPEQLDEDTVDQIMKSLFK
jgi:hypothetical protein